MSMFGALSQVCYFLENYVHVFGATLSYDVMLLSRKLILVIGRLKYLTLSTTNAQCGKPRSTPRPPGKKVITVYCILYRFGTRPYKTEHGERQRESKERPPEAQLTSTSYVLLPVAFWGQNLFFFG